MTDLDIVDAHHHLWDLANSYPWLQNEPGEPGVAGDDRAIRKNYLVSDLIADANGLRLVKSVHIEANPGDPIAETAWLQQTADEHGFPHGIVANADLTAAGVANDLEQHRSYGNVRGVRQILNYHPDPRLTYIDRDDLMRDKHWRAGFALLEPLGLSFDLQIYPAQMHDAARLAADFPSTSIVLEHTGMPIGRDREAFDEWRQGMRLLASQDNVTAKISGLGMTDHNWTVDSIRPFVLETIEIFGPDRAMFASNFPVDGLYSTYGELYEAYDELTATLSDSEREAVFGKTAIRTYRL